MKAGNPVALYKKVLLTQYKLWSMVLLSQIK